jgi:hypothetical protein
MFHAKILWFYHANPHIHAPLEFQGDLWLRFMRWVHTPSAYGPVMTAIESPAYLLGMGKFVPVLYLMKATMSLFFVWSVYLCGRIAHKLKMTLEQQLIAQIMIAFNPFLLLELIINAHNDIIMMALFLASLLLALQNQKVKSLALLLVSVGVKFVTTLTAPITLFFHSKHWVLTSSILLLLPVLLSPSRFQPWYLSWSLIPAVLIGKQWARIWIIMASMLAVIFYVPYIATGFWNNSPLFVYIILYSPLIFAVKWALPAKPSL